MIEIVLASLAGPSASRTERKGSSPPGEKRAAATEFGESRRNLLDLRADRAQHRRFHHRYDDLLM